MSRLAAVHVLSALVAANLRRQGRDRIGLFFMVILPFVIIVVVGLALGGHAGDGQRLRLGLVVEGAGSGELVARFAEHPELTVVRVAGVAELRRQIGQGSLVAGLVLPDGVGDRAVRLPFYLVDGSGEAAVVRNNVHAVLGRYGALAGAERMAGRLGASPAQVDLVVARTDPIFSDVRVVPGAETLRLGFAYTAPANLVLFTFINSAAVAGSLVETRRLGISRRSLAAPVRPWVLLAGEVLSRYVIALLQALLVVVVTALLFGVEWGPPAGVLLVVAAFCLVSTGVAMLVGGLAGTGMQAAALGPPIGIVLGMLGGCMWPLLIVPPLLRDAGHVFPHAWAMDALLALPQRGLDGAMTPAAVLLAMGVAVTAVSLHLFRRSVLRTR
ncbi:MULTISPECIES: ABC transporter permease [unclassified Nonomuraea]|uniref:ABC transporter permease n=1 Tax=unclassified Nonomuraea TaxID=2593643 RepID=UPI00191C6676|nr:ABC transporter permease [Nonomuraea sp. KC401]